MIDVVILNCQFGHASTFIAPAEVLSSAGVMWNNLNGQPAEPRFRVRTVSVDGRPVRSPAEGEAQGALLALGYKPGEIVRMLKDLDGGRLSTEDMIREALKRVHRERVAER